MIRRLGFELAVEIALNPIVKLSTITIAALASNLFFIYNGYFKIKQVPFVNRMSNMLRFI